MQIFGDLVMKKFLYKLSFIPYFIAGLSCIASVLVNFGFSHIINSLSEELFSFLCDLSYMFFNPVSYFAIICCALYQYFYRRSNNIVSDISPSKVRVLKILFYTSLIPYTIFALFALLIGVYAILVASVFSSIFIVCLFYQIYFTVYLIRRYNIKVNKKAILCLIVVFVISIVRCIVEQEI